MTQLYPPIDPYATGRLAVGDGHELYWERVGTPGARPALLLHGGPGAGISPLHRRFFDPARYDVLLFDQRGAGRSTPHAGLEANSTDHLVADIERLRAMVGVDRWLVFGGSWGSTLGLTYAQAHPAHVSHLVLRGIFLFGQDEIDWLYRYGASEIFPAEWDSFLSLLDPADRLDPIGAYHRLLTHDDRATRIAAAKAWSGWEGVTLTLLPNAEVMASVTDDDHALAVARLENHYMRHKGWLGEGQLLAHADRLRQIPTIIVQGRYDICTPPSAAWRLARAMPHAQLRLVDAAGHSVTEPGIAAALVEATDQFAA